MIAFSASGCKSGAYVDINTARPENLGRLRAHRVGDQNLGHVCRSVCSLVLMAAALPHPPASRALPLPHAERVGVRAPAEVALSSGGGEFRRRRSPTPSRARGTGLPGRPSPPSLPPTGAGRAVRRDRRRCRSRRPPARPVAASRFATAARWSAGSAANRGSTSFRQTEVRERHAASSARKSTQGVAATQRSIAARLASRPADQAPAGRRCVPPSAARPARPPPPASTAC